MNEFKMSLFLAPISPVKDGGTGQIIKPATLKPYKTMTLQEVYRTITANTRLQLLTDRVRRAFDSGDLSAYRALKQELLPYVTPCGTFGRRRSDSLLEASGLVVVDIDHLDSADEAARLRRQLFEDPFLRPELVFISPCGQGVKAFVPYTPDPAIFSVGIVSRKGAASADAFTLADNVKGLKLRARATGELSNAQINLEGQLKEASKYSPDNSGAGGSTPGGGNGEEENPLG